ncbi:PH domain-containing protein [Nitrososphaera sp.]|uniref:PH domain-containing protein n=1 Tax=Nitrososphaera sp. TaxID=1971748 RepID=UPI00307F91E9
MLEKVDPEIAGMLMPDEEILLIASQSKMAPGGSLSSPNKIYVTTGRVLFKDPKWFGLKAKIIGVKFEDISTVMLRRGVFTTEIYLKPRFSSQKIELPAVDKKVAIHASLLIQKGMRGELNQFKRKTRIAMQQQVVDDEQGEDDDDDGAEPMIVQKRRYSDNNNNHHHRLRGADPLAKVEKLAVLKQQGIITEQEFQVLKEEVMFSLKPEVIEEDWQRQQRRQRQQRQEGAGENTDGAANPSATTTAAEKKAQSSGIELTTCRYCNSAGVPAKAKFCPDCGKDLRTETNVWKMCPSCDALMTGDSVFCAACKEKFPETLS